MGMAEGSRVTVNNDLEANRGGIGSKESQIEKENPSMGSWVTASP